MEGPVVRFVQRLVGSEAVAEEIAQETFVQVYRSVGQFREDCKVSSWVYRIALNLAKNSKRASKARPEFAAHGATASASGVADGVAGQDAEPHAHAEGMETEQVVRLALAQMPLEFRECLILCDLEDLSYDEIAEIVKAPVGTVKSRIARGRQSLKERLAAHRGEGSQ